MVVSGTCPALNGFYAHIALGVFMKKVTMLLVTAALVQTASSASAQTGPDNSLQSPPQDRIESILGSIFGDRSRATGSLEGQWASGRTPLATQQRQFEARVDSDVSSGGLNQRTGLRLKNDYSELVQLEARYGADGRFTMQERSDLSARYNALTQVLTNQSYGDDNMDQGTSVADNRAEFVGRVDMSIASRRISRIAGNRLKADYDLLVQTEANYLRDGVLSERERDDLDARLDSLDERVGDTAYSGNTVKQTARVRLTAIANAISSSRLTVSAQTQLRTEHSDLTYLEAAYARYTPSTDERNYLEQRLSDLEQRLQIRMR